MEYKSYKTYGKVIVAQSTDYKWGVLDLEGNEIVPFGKYGWIDGFYQGLARVRTHGNSGRVANTVAIFNLDSEANLEVIEGKEDLEDYIKSDRVKHPKQYAKWGIINEEGEEVLPVEYDDIWKFLGKKRSSTKVVKDGESHEVYFHALNPSLLVSDLRNISRSYEDYDYNAYWRNDDGIDYEEETWYALTDGQYGDYPGPDVDYDFLGF